MQDEFVTGIQRFAWLRTRSGLDARVRYCRSIRRSDDRRYEETTAERRLGSRELIAFYYVINRPLPLWVRLARSHSKRKWNKHASFSSGSISMSRMKRGPDLSQSIRFAWLIEYRIVFFTVRTREGWKKNRTPWRAVIFSSVWKFDGVWYFFRAFIRIRWNPTVTYRTIFYGCIARYALIFRAARKMFVRTPPDYSDYFNAILIFGG